MCFCAYGPSFTVTELRGKAMLLPAGVRASSRGSDLEYDRGVPQTDAA